MLITVEMLKAKDACENQVRIFAKEWPEGVRVTKQALERAVELGLDIDWAAQNLLPAPAWAAYAQAIAPAWAAYGQEKATAWAAYAQARATAWAAYDQARATARAAYDQARAPALAAYNQATATAFYNAVYPK